jgi:PX domain
MEKSSVNPLLATAAIKVPKYGKEWVQGKEVIFYDVECAVQGVSWTIKKRFSDFETLYTNLKKSHSDLPALPGKTILPISKPEDLEKRRSGLEKFLDGLVSRQDIYSNKEYLDFLEMETYKPELAVNPIETVGSMSEVLMAYRDIVFSSDRSMYFAAVSDPKVTSRLDSYIANFKLPWDNEPDTKSDVTLAVGQLEAWIKDADSASPFIYKKLWTKQFKSQAIRLEYCQEMRYVATGLDNGHVSVLELSKATASKYNEILSKGLHSSRVIRINIQMQRSKDSAWMYTLGEDKMLKIVCLRSQETLHSVYASTRVPCDMVINFASCIGYVSDRDGFLNVVDLASNPPFVRQFIKTGCDGPIRALAAEFEEGKIFVSGFDDGKVHLMKIDNINDSNSLIVKSVTVKGTKEARTMFYHKQRKELFIGHQNGLLSVINFTEGKESLLLSAKIHLGNINSMKLLFASSLPSEEGFDKNNITFKSALTQDLLLTAGNDRYCRFWLLPNTFLKSDLIESSKCMSTVEGTIMLNPSPARIRDDSDNDEED